MTLCARVSLPFALLGMAVLYGACASPKSEEAAPSHATCGDAQVVCPPTAPIEAPAEDAEIRNVILLIGDGMGPQQVGLLELYARYANDPRYPERTSHIGQLINVAKNSVVLSTPADGLVNESATGATQLASGLTTKFGYLGLNAAGEPIDSAIDVARRLGLKTAILSDTRLTHATPASFGAHTHDRWDENGIAAQLVESETDVMLSGGWRYFLPKSANDRGSKAALASMYDIPVDVIRSTRNDERNLLEEARNHGYAVTTTVQGLRDAQGDKLLGLFGSSGMQNGTEWLAERDAEMPSQPSLGEMFRHAVRFLKQGDSKGFFMMIEGGQIDWAGHGNKAQLLLHEMLRFDALVAEVMQFAKEDGNTAVILTADHETGGFSIFYDRNGPPGPEIFANLDAFPNYVRFATTAHTHTPILASFVAPDAFLEPIPGLMHQTQVGQIVLDWVKVAGRDAE